MKVLYDHQAFLMQKYGGVSRCFVELYKHFSMNCQAQFALRECNNAYIREENLSPAFNSEIERWLLPYMWRYKTTMFNTYQQIKGHHRYFYWDKYGYNQEESIRLLKRGDFDIFHPTFFSDYFLPYLNGKPFVLTIHDMISELYPQYFDAENDIQILGKKKLAPLASAIVAVSEKTKEDIVRILNVPEDKVHVVYHGCSFSIPEQLSSFFDFPYILYVGERRNYKNFDYFVKYASSVLLAHPELKIVCTGISFRPEELQLMDSYGVIDRFVQKWTKTDDELYSLYHYATCFVYTSEYEGFGIPILEAYKADCPVMLNNTSCFPEIAADAAIYFEMTKEDSNFEAQFDMLYSMSNEDRKSLIEKQRSRLDRYSWEKSAQQLMEVYKSVL